MDIASVDISGACFLGTIQVDEQAEFFNNLAKISEGGTQEDILPVNFNNAHGKIIQEEFLQVNVRSILPVNTRYSILYGLFEFELQGGVKQSSALLLDLHNGALYDLGFDYYLEQNNYYLGSEYHQCDRQGYVYFRGRGGIWRFQFEDGQEVGIQLYVDYPGGDYDHFYVDPDANVYFDTGGKVKRTSGGILDTDASMVPFTGFDGNAYGISFVFEPELWIYALSVDEDGFRKTPICESSVLLESLYDGLYHYPDSIRESHLFFSSFILMDGGSGWTPVQGVVYVEENQKMYEAKFKDSAPSATNELGMEGKYLWLQSSSNEQKLFCVDVSQYTIDEATQTANFEQIQEFDLPASIEIQWIACEWGVIRFRAYDLSKERQVYGMISVAHGIEYWEESDTGMKILSRIN